MSSVGIIANPASGKDIRRLVAHATVFDNNEKVNLLRRIILGLQSLPVQEVLFMPDYFGFYSRALEPLMRGAGLGIEARQVEMKLNANQEDSRLAAEKMAAAGVKCIITLGGDGTGRAAAKGSGEVPLLPISTGTNNVFPVIVEGTIAGLAAGLYAAGLVNPENVLNPTKKLVIYKNGAPVDIALIDAVVLDEQFIGSKAVWETEKVKQVVVTRGEPVNIGMTSLAGCLRPVGPGEPLGLHVTIDHEKPAAYTRAAVGPGLIKKIPVSAYQLVSPGQRIPVNHTPCVIALDGERDIQAAAGEKIEIELSEKGPPVIDIPGTMAEAARKQVFCQEA